MRIISFNALQGFITIRQILFYVCINLNAWPSSCSLSALKSRGSKIIFTASFLSLVILISLWQVQRWIWAQCDSHWRETSWQVWHGVRYYYGAYDIILSAFSLAMASFLANDHCTATLSQLFYFNQTTAQDPTSSVEALRSRNHMRGQNRESTAPSPPSSGLQFRSYQKDL